jgi:4-diphosphocytidyl-2-C-methyl-D-erythritol kinase
VRLSALAPGKVNLCLLVGRPRDDGRHELVTVLESVSLADRLTLTTGGYSDEIHCPGVTGPNLATQALAALREAGWDAPPVCIEIDKRVPVAGGMGGGSADAAAVLRMALHVTEPPPGTVAEIAASLGSDVPGQLVPGTMRATGAGESVQALEPLPPHAFVLVPLPHHLRTADVYAEADRLGLPREDAELVSLSQEVGAGFDGRFPLPRPMLVNDLEPAAVSLCPEIEEVLEAVRGCGADHAMVCGSGPTVAGVHWGDNAGARAVAAALSLAERYPAAVPAEPVGTAFGMPRPD